MAPSADRGADRLLVLGAGRHQKQLIRRAEARGIAVVAADYYPDAPGKAFATFPTLTDAVDLEAVIGLAHEYSVGGVITMGTDMTVRTMAQAARECGLPSYVSPEGAVIATDKVNMATAFAREGVRRPRSVEVDSASDASRATAEMTLPLVVKPADSQGQRATARVDDARHVEAAVAAACAESRSSRAIVEEFIQGGEVTASVWMTRGEAHILIVADRVTYNPPPAIGIAFQHVFPSIAASGALDAIEAQIAGVARAFGVTDGPLYVQMIVGDDEVYVIEAGARVGGGHESSLIPIATGVDVVDRLIDLALTGAAEPVDYRYGHDPVHRHAAVTFLVASEGTVAAADGFAELIRTHSVEEGEFYVGAGHVQGAIVDSLGRVGYFIATGPHRSGLEARARAAYGRLEICDAEGRNLLFWPPQELMNG